MAYRLGKVASDLNVPQQKIVDFLVNKGITIPANPSALIPDDMYQLLVSEFQDQKNIKDQAERLNIGPTKPTHRKEDDPVHTTHPTFDRRTNVNPIQSLFGRKQPADLTTNSSAAPQPQTPPEQTTKPPATTLDNPTTGPQTDSGKVSPLSQPSPDAPQPAADAADPTQRPDTNKPGLKVVGKIDIDTLPNKGVARKPEPQKPSIEQPETRRAPDPQSVTRPAHIAATSQADPAVQDPSVPAHTTETKPQPPAQDPPAATDGDAELSNNVLSQRSQTLKGLTIVGKVNDDVLRQSSRTGDSRPKRRRVVVQGSGQTATGSGQATGGANNFRSGQQAAGNNRSGQQSHQRNDRQGQQAGAANNRSGQQNNRHSHQPNNRQTQRPQEHQPREISPKEIEEKLRATLAAVTGNRSATKLRQKGRRDSRNAHRDNAQAAGELEGVKKLQVTEFVTVSELAGLMDISASDLILTLMNMNINANLNQRLDAENIELLALEFGYEVEFISAESEMDLIEEEDDPASLVPRAPIVTVMGHVDHGKTSLLDYIRKTRVAAGEAGGITQHIGAYEVLVDNDRKVTFLDTPGHEAFTAMRARGAKITDVAVIIVAADDSVMPQTKEAISHAQAAGVPIVFAINKIDKEGADPERIKSELAQMNFLVEEWGGKYQSQDISAKTGTGIDQLLEKILLESDLLELKANPDRRAIASVIEASLDKGRGYVTKVLVHNGTLREGDIIVSGEYSGRVKAMFNENNQRVKSAGPSTPVLVLGLNGAPAAGEKFKVMESEQEARLLASKRQQIAREQASRASKHISLDEIGRRLALGNFKELNLIVKGDVDGSVEALSDALLKLTVETVAVRVIHKAVGAITESDVMLASASDAIIVGFQVRPSANARKLSEQEGVQIKTYSIIYEAIEEIKSAIEGMLEPTKEEKIIGLVEVRALFKISKLGTVAGSYVSEGKISKSNYVRVIRDGIVIFPNKEGVHGEIASLKREKEDVREVKFGFECGVMLKNFNDFMVGDTIEAYEIVEVKRTI